MVKYLPYLLSCPSALRLTANPWYLIDSTGACDGKFTFATDNTITADYIDENGTAGSQSFDYVLDASGNITMTSGSSTNTYFSSSENLFTFKSHDINANEFSAITAFKSYQDAMDYGNENGNSDCSAYIPQ